VNTPEDFNYKRGKAIPVQARTTPEGSRRLRLMKVVSMTALCTSHLYLLEDIPGANFC